MGIMDYMANGIKMEQNIVLPATLQAKNLSLQSYHSSIMWTDHLYDIRKILAEAVLTKFSTLITAIFKE
ncbi:hypothetical protein RclHR1_18140005 [Rhizophagus clarus]|uniref:Uncharacterized protein n=1 Tax=Rhizophagus clarus TaxID=94130 RepID=A0A2Z6R0A8_9GLOM|nr:hypothetical protein RclHR1_18140005 [Rhizophagus clarus]